MDVNVAQKQAYFYFIIYKIIKKKERFSNRNHTNENNTTALILDKYANIIFIIRMQRLIKLHVSGSPK